jgi:hypothetical protein
MWTEEMAATGCGHLEPALRGFLTLDRRDVTRCALPLTTGHLHPSVSPTYVFIESLSLVVLGPKGKLAGDDAIGYPSAEEDVNRLTRKISRNLALNSAKS